MHDRPVSSTDAMVDVAAAPDHKMRAQRQVFFRFLLGWFQADVKSLVTHRLPLACSRQWFCLQQLAPRQQAADPCVCSESWATCVSEVWERQTLVDIILD
ncbi:hypothetical protein BKK81_33870 (plasmid) [Cupriavidus sp. USMAHM13]|nr:hypothetical protein BKK81_33870 [Cupriavidus sp. USMAHM13]